ncbi:MAG: hypothetical protein JWO30_272 [Fibrobacteres bacterium]|nr:hypothetical protein [Fibrobacterota bacterium]
MGTPFLALMLSLIAAAPAVHGQAPDSAQPSTPAATREEKRAMKVRTDKVRREARMGHNFLIGAGPVFCLEAPLVSQADTKVESPGLGISLGYRTQLKEKIGFKGESKFYLASTYVSAIRDSLGSPHVTNHPFSSFDGYKGQTVLIETLGSMVIGPFGRFTLDPGLGFTWIRHSLDSIGVTGDAGDFQVPLVRSLTTVDLSLAASMLLGKRDEYNLSVGEILGINTASAKDGFIQVFFGFSYAFQFPKG